MQNKEAPHEIRMACVALLLLLLDFHMKYASSLSVLERIKDDFIVGCVHTIHSSICVTHKMKKKRRETHPSDGINEIKYDLETWQFSVLRERAHCTSELNESKKNDTEYNRDTNIGI